MSVERSHGYPQDLLAPLRVSDADRPISGPSLRLAAAKAEFAERGLAGATSGATELDTKLLRQLSRALICQAQRGAGEDLGEGLG